MDEFVAMIDEVVMWMECLDFGIKVLVLLMLVYHARS